MNTYDFDQTIYQPDSSCSFYLFCLKKYPSAVLRTLPKTVAFAVAYWLKRIKTKRLKEQFFSFLPYLPDVDAAVADFWDEHRAGIEKWYLDQKKEDDVIISASPYFLLRPIAKELGVGLIATPMDKHTGKILGENCHIRSAFIPILSPTRPWRSLRTVPFWSQRESCPPGPVKTDKKQGKTLCIIDDPVLQ